MRMGFIMLFAWLCARILTKAEGPLNHKAETVEEHSLLML
jgi:hypothetical protein